MPSATLQIKYLPCLGMTEYLALGNNSFHVTLHLLVATIWNTFFWNEPCVFLSQVIVAKVIPDSSMGETIPDTYKCLTNQLVQYFSLI